MRTHQRCPKCTGTKLYVCTNHQPDGDNANYVHPLHVTAIEVPAKKLGVTHGTLFRTHVGSYETWICASCGYTEWYARDPAHLLEKLSKLPDSGVRVVDSTPVVPYR